MRKFAIVVLLALSALCARPSAAATPTFFHVRNCSVAQAGNNTDFRCRLPQPSLAGNLLWAAFEYGAANTPTVTDDKSQTWTCNTARAGGQQVRDCFFANTVAGVVEVHIHFTAGVAGVGVQLMEMNNIATSSPVDVTCGSNTASGTSAPCGSMTTTVDGDAIVEYCAQDSAPTNQETFTAGSGFQMVTNDKYDSQAAQWGVQAVHGAINPTMTMSAANSKTCTGTAFKNASAGNAPSGMYVQSMLDESLNPSNAWTSGATTLNEPCISSANAYFFSFIGEPNITINGSGISDSNSNSPASTGATIANTSSGNLQAYQKASGGTLSSTMTVSFTTTGSQISGSTAIFFCIAGSGGYDLRGTATGNQTVAGTQTTASVTPTHPSGITFWVMGVTSDTVNGVNTGTFNSAIPTPVASPNPVDQNNGWGNFSYSSTATETFVASASLGGTAYSLWAATADVFFAPAAANFSVNKRRKLDQLGEDVSF